MVHKLKCWPLPFQAILNGEKTFELRKNDRGYREGDIVLLKEWDEVLKRSTGRKASFVIGCTISEPFAFPGLLEGYCVFSLLPCQFRLVKTQAENRNAVAKRMREYRKRLKLRKASLAPAH